jgi:hypothetical protein
MYGERYVSAAQTKTINWKYYNTYKDYFNKTSVKLENSQD